MELWIRSIARAGGVEIPATARVLEPRSERPAASVRRTLARALRRAGAYLVRAGDRVCSETNAALGRC